MELVVSGILRNEDIMSSLVQVKKFGNDSD
jgi:hypothetical protein